MTRIQSDITGLNPRQAQEDAEMQRRRALLDKELGPIRDTVTPEQYEELLLSQRKHSKMGKVEEALQWHDINEKAGEKGTDHAYDTAKNLLGKEGKSYLDSLGPRTGPSTKEEFDAIMNSPAYRKGQKKFNKMAGDVQGREFEFVDKVAGYEDRASTYAEGLAKGIKDGVYRPGTDDHVFDDDVFKRRWTDSRRMDKWQLDSHMKALKGEIGTFEKTRQKLTENYQRMDPFGRTQYKEMEKKAKGLERARQEGRLRPLEYLRHMSQLADGTKTIQWQYHMKSPGGEVGDIWDKDGDGGFYQRGPDGTVKMVKMSPEYFDSKVKKLDDGLWLIPTIDKDGREVMKEVKGGAPGVDWKEKQEYNKQIEKLTEKYADEWLGENDPEDMETAFEYGQQKAIKRVSEIKKISDQLTNPKEENPDADPEAFVKNKTDNEKEAAYQEGQLEAKKRAMGMFAQRRLDREKMAEAVGPVQKVVQKRGESFRVATDGVRQKSYNDAMDKWMQDNPQIDQWVQAVKAGQEPGPPPETSPRPAEPKPSKGPEQELGGTYDQFVKEAMANDELRHFIANESTTNPALQHLVENPIPIRSEAMRNEKHIRNGFIYSHMDKSGVAQLFLKHKGKWFPLGPQDMNGEEKPVEEDRGMFGNMIDHGNQAANQASGGNL